VTCPRRAPEAPPETSGGGAAVEEQERALEDLQHLHADVERRAAALALRHGPRLRCRRGCADCCVDELRVFEVEAERIRRAAPSLLQEGEPHPPGACALLDTDGSCRVYPHRPYVCRTQGLPLRWFDELRTGGVVERRDICPLNAEGPAAEALAESECWTIGPAEGRLAGIQRRFGAGRLERVALRSLFANPPKSW
jgi:hypothetical protein